MTAVNIGKGMVEDLAFLSKKLISNYVAVVRE
jgi:hypothetical protein